MKYIVQHSFPRNPILFGHVYLRVNHMCHSKVKGHIIDTLAKVVINMQFA